MITPGDLRLRAPVPGESLDGFIADIVGDNDLHRVRSVSGAGGVTYGHRPTLTTMGWQSLPALAALLEVDLQELQHRSYPNVESEVGRRAFFGTTIHRGDLRTRERFYSPAALARSPHHRAMWQLRLPYDLETGELLVSTCPSTNLCGGKAQRWRHSAGVRYCDVCVTDLSRQQVPVIDPAINAEYVVAAGLTHTDPAVRAKSLAELPMAISTLGADMAFELLTRLVPVANSLCGWTSSSRIWRNDPTEIAKGICGAWHILKGWPHSLLERIRSDLANGQKRHDDGNRGANRRLLATKKAEGLPACLRQLIEESIQAISLDGPNGPHLKVSTLTAVETSTIIRIGTKELVDLRRAGAFRTIAALRGKLLVPLFDRAEVLQIAAELPGRLELNSVSEKLGLPYYAVEQLAARDFLPSPSHPYLKHRYALPQTTREAFETLVTRLHQQRSALGANAEPIIALMRMIGGGPKPWATVVEAMLSGVLPYSLEPDASAAFGGIQVEGNALRRLLGVGTTRPSVDRFRSNSPQGSSSKAILLTKRDAGEILNLTERVAGMVLERYPTSSSAVVPLTDVEALARMHVTPDELAARLGVTLFEVKEVARELGIRRNSKAGYHVAQDARLTAALRADHPIALPLPLDELR